MKRIVPKKYEKYNLIPNHVKNNEYKINNYIIKMLYYK